MTVFAITPRVWLKKARQIVLALLVIFPVICPDPVASAQKGAIKRPSREHQVYFADTQDELSVYRVYGAEPGKTLMLIGGIQGDEPGGFLSADLYADITLAKGNLIVVPRANFYSIILRRRAPDGDMNRQFGDPVTARRHKKIVAILKKLMAESDMLLNLHDGSGFFRPNWEGPMANPKRYGQSLIADTDKYKRPDGSILDLRGLAERVLKRVNLKISNHKYRILFNNHRTASIDSLHKEQRRSATYYALTQCHIPAYGVETSKSLPSQSLKVRHHVLVINEFMNELGIEPENPGAQLENPMLKFLVVSLNNELPVVVSNQGTINVKPGDKVKVVHIEANYERGLSCDINGMGSVYDQRQEFVVRKSTTIVVRKDHSKIGQVFIKVSGKAQAFTTVRSPLLYFLVDTSQGGRRLVAQNETLKVVRGDRIKFVDVISNLANQHSLRLNFKGYVPPGPGKNAGEDRGYTINTATELMSRYSMCKGEKDRTECYMVEASRNDQLLGSMRVDVVPARLQYLVLKRQNGHKLVFHNGETIRASWGERLEIVDFKTNMGQDEDITLSLVNRGKRFSITGSTIDTARKPLEKLLRRAKGPVKLLVMRAKQTIGHVQLSMGDK
jgi:hypothetical protein